MKLEIRHFFDSAHQLPDTEYLVTKACARLHGHTYAVIVTFENIDEALNPGGMVVDFKGIKNIIDTLDHQFINDIFKKDKIWKDVPTTAENIARYLHRKIYDTYPDIQKISVSVCEGYKGADRANWVTYKL